MKGWIHMKLATVALGCILALGSLQAAPAEIHWTLVEGLLPDDSLCYPTVSDFDGDGDDDISPFCASPIHHHWNLGPPGAPEWQVDTGQFGGLPPCYDRHGALGDVDGDGDQDLVLACYDGSVKFCRNVGTPLQAVWEYEPTVCESVSVMSGGACPALADLDADGDLDLAITVDFGCVRYCENTGSAGDPHWRETCWIDGLVVGPAGEGQVVFGDIDLDGDLDAVGITQDSPLQCWENVGTPQNREFVENPSMIAGIDQPPDKGFGVGFIDIDRDGDLDILIDALLTESFLYLNELVTPVESATWGSVKALYR